MTFDLAAFATPAHFQPLTNRLSRQRSPLTAAGDTNVHARVFTHLGVAKQIPPDQYGTGSRANDSWNGTQRTPGDSVSSAPALSTQALQKLC